MSKDDRLKVWNGVFALIAVGGALLIGYVSLEAGSFQQMLAQPDNWLEFAIYALIIFAACKIVQLGVIGFSEVMGGRSK